eukprot:1797052-Amphidinium_carterae.1
MGQHSEERVSRTLRSQDVWKGLQGVNTLVWCACIGSVERTRWCTTTPKACTDRTRRSIKAVLARGSAGVPHMCECLGRGQAP